MRGALGGAGGGGGEVVVAVVVGEWYVAPTLRCPPSPLSITVLPRSSRSPARPNHIDFLIHCLMNAPSAPWRKTKLTRRSGAKPDLIRFAAYVGHHTRDI